MLKNMSLITLLAASLVACGGSDEEKCCTITPISSSSVAAVSSAAAVSSTAAVSSAAAVSSVAAVSSAATVSSAASEASSSAEASSVAGGETSASSVASSVASSSASSQAGTTYTFTSVDGWSVNGGGSPNQMQVELNAATGSGINMVPIDWNENAGKSYMYEARFTLPTPVNIAVGTKITYTLSIPQSYITDATAVLQINWHNGTTSQYGGEDGGYRTLSTAGGVPAVTDFVMTETVKTKALAGTTMVGLQLSKAPTNQAIKDKILIKSIHIE